MCDGGDRDRRVLYFSIFIIKEREERERERDLVAAVSAVKKKTGSISKRSRWRIPIGGE